MKRVFAIALFLTLLISSLSFAQNNSTNSLSTQPDLRELITLDLKKDSKRIEEIVSEYKGSNIELYLITAYVEPNGDYKTRFNYLLLAVYGNKVMMTGPSFMFKDVNYYDLKLVGENKPDSFDVGLICKVYAKVDGMEDDFILLDPISIEVVSADVAERETTKKSTENTISPSKKKYISGYNLKTNQTLSWCGVDFSFPTYFDVKSVEADNWLHYYPEQEEYYASMFFQSYDFTESKESFIQNIPYILDTTFVSNGRNAELEIVESKSITIAGLPGWTVKYVYKDGSSDAYYSIAFNPAVNKVLMISCIVDRIDQSNFDYFGDYHKMLAASKLSSDSYDAENINSASIIDSIYEYAFATRGGEYSNYMLFDVDGKVVRSFSSNDNGVLVGTIKGDLSSGITIYFDYDGGWKETFHMKPGSQTEAILTDNDGFEVPFEQTSVEEAEAYLHKEGYKDIN